MTGLNCTNCQKKVPVKMAVWDTNLNLPFCCMTCLIDYDADEESKLNGTNNAE